MANPCSILEVQPTTAANCEIAAQLADWLLADQPELRKKVCRALLCRPDEARQAMIETVKFMWLAAGSSTGRLVPAHRVDLAWHELILFTRTYHQLCDKYFGKFVHHQPEGIFQEGGQEGDQRFSATLSRYRQVFGSPPVDFWGTCETKFKSESNTSTCGTCESQQGG